MQSFEQVFSTLNTEQKAAVTHTSGPLLVIAGAGSGKTKVATMRVAYLVRTGVPAHAIAGVTFTNKAAKEMRERVHALVGSKVTVSTFHSLGATILRESIHHLGYPSSFVIYDEEESGKVLKDCLREMALEYQDSLFSTLRASISSIKNNPSAKIDPKLSSLYEMYQRRLKTSGAVDFDDLIYLPLRLFKEVPDLVAMYQNRWEHLLVDEYQDTNDTQHLLATALVGKTKNIFAVGDPDQSIYSWRGAKIENILSFKKDFPGAQVISLEQNYRSTNAILEASNNVIGYNIGRYEKNLWSSRGKGELLTKHIAKSERQEADFVVRTIKSLLQAGRSPDEIAILYRTNAQSRSFEDQFLAARTPYRIWGGIPFYSRKEIKDVLSFLRLAALPQDTAAFERAIKAFGQGIGDVTIQKIKTLSLAKGSPIFTLVQEELANPSLSFTKRQKEALTAFSTIITTLQENLQEGTAFDLISAAANETGYLSSLESDPETLSDRKENIEQLLSRAQEWDDTHENTPPHLFFEELTLEGAQVDDGDPRKKVTLATIHNAKGLEFSCVFLVGLEEDLFPHMNAKRSEDMSAIEEERRLFYVGMTRAKDQLFLSAAQTRFLFGGLRMMRPSRFWKEIPENLMKTSSSFSFTPPPRQSEEKVEEKKAEPFEPGQLVLHPQFGIGRIEKIAHTSMGDVYEIFFSNDQVTKKLLASAAPLKLIGKPK